MVSWMNGRPPPSAPLRADTDPAARHRSPSGRGRSRAHGLVEDGATIPEAGESATRRHGTRLLFRRSAPPAIQAGEHGKDKTGIHVHRPFQQHGALAFIAGS